MPSMNKERPQHPRPWSLKLVVLYKAVLGLVEVVFGFTFTFVALGIERAAASSLIQSMISKELGEDPNDFFIHWLLTHNLPVSLRTAMQVSLVVLFIGVVKLIIAYAIWKHSHKAQVVTLVLVGALGVAGAVDTVHAFGWFKVLATAMDFVLFYYLAWVLPKHVPLDEFEAQG